MAKYGEKKLGRGLDAEMPFDARGRLMEAARVAINRLMEFDAQSMWALDDMDAVIDTLTSAVEYAESKEVE